ncbi:MAG: D-alanyl-D-alanine carboxypeptidase/D-alanyl-D-alanine endopeptidase, partial [Longimicrobiales bacterium]
MRIARLFSLVLLAAAPAVQAQTATPASIDDILERGELERAHWGVHAIDAQTGAVVYSRNADQLFVPASNLKLVVAAAGAHYLGADYVWRTELLAGGSVESGDLRGDLVIRGSGDPGISGRFADGEMLAVLEAWADSLSARGIERIGGAVVADQTLWDAQLRSPDWEIYDVNWWYAAPVAPLGFNDNAVDFRVQPGGLGEPAHISWAPRTRSFVFDNRTRTVAAGGDYTLDFDRIAGTDTIFAYGELPVDAEARTEYFAVDDPGRHFATVFLEVLGANGIDVAASLGRSAYAPAPAPAGTPLFTWTSAPLPVTIAPILLTSQNWFAEQLLKT